MREEKATRARSVLNKRGLFAKLEAMAQARERPPLDPPRGILQRPRADGLLAGRRVAPSEALAPFVHHFWAVEWNLRTPFVAEVLFHPSASLTVERGHRPEVVGVRTARTRAIRTGKGRAFGVTFRPAAFQQLLRAPMSSLTDRSIPLETVLGQDGEAWAHALLDVPHVEASLSMAEAFLVARLRPLSRDATRMRDITERAKRDPSLFRSSDLASALGIDVRWLQRLFRHYVGVGPKWILQRYRLLEAAEQLKTEAPPPLADLAASLGYADQAHFSRDFKRVVGQAPGAFMTLRQSARTVGRSVS